MKKNKNKKLIIFEICKSFAIFLVIAVTLLNVRMAFAEGEKDAPPEAGYVGSVLDKIGGQSKLPDFASGHADATYEPGASRISSAILYAVDLFKYLLGSIAVIVIIMSGIRLITSVKNVEEVANKQKEHLKYAIFGLAVVLMADALVKQVFFGEAGEVYRSEADIKLAAERGNDHIRGLYSLISMVIGALAVLMIVIAGFRMVVGAGKEEANTSAKKQITWAIIGLMLVGVSEVAVKNILFPSNGGKLPDVNAANLQIIQITNFISGFVATIAVAMFMYGGYLYVVDFGKEEQAGKAKKVFTGAIIGLLLAMGAFALVNTVIKVEPLKVEATQQTENP